MKGQLGEFIRGIKDALSTKKQEEAASDSRSLEEREHLDQEVDISSEESFPASDPPAWTGTHGTGPANEEPTDDR